MTRQDEYPAGAPCWVDTWQHDPRAARAFYGPLFGWSFDPPVDVDGAGEYFTARLSGRRVAGIGQAPPSSPAVWNTHIATGEIENTLTRIEAAGGARLAGPLSVGSDGWMSVVADSTGVPFAIWHAGQRVGAGLTGEPGAWAMSSLHTRDLKQAQAFYGTLFDWELEPVPGAPFREWRLAGKLVAVAMVTDGVTVPPHWSVNFAVGDVDAACEHAIGLGGSLLMPPFDTPGFRNALIADPQGAVIALSSSAR